jgi:hypothetical protein
VIRQEKRRRLKRLPDDDYAYDQWQFHDEPFVNELCLVLLVAIRHQVERELLRLAARVTSDGEQISGKQFLERLQGLQNKRNRWNTIIVKLHLSSFPDWNRTLKTLQILANCYKHDPSQGPTEELLKHLGLDLTVNYASLAESPAVRRRLALSLKLGKDADFCDIAESILKRVDSFLRSVERQPLVSKVKWGAVSLHPKDMLH